MRLFVALYPPPPVREHLTAQVSRLVVGTATAAGLNVRLADPENLHLTLAFLGEVDDDRQPDVEAALAQAVADRRRWAPSIPMVQVGGGGRFGRGPATVLWAGLRGDVEGLNVLSRLVRVQLRQGRLPFDDKPFRPHLTIARPGDRIDAEGLAADQAALDNYEGPLWPVTTMSLVSSRLGPHPRHDRLASWSL
ncbi:RNA 2',3'-cyclic phosphodiesterase [Micromonosporaceae bacterium DT194]|uniref:RNA 2',3'-cyclic phosphodiesterase n=1 Tax=Melissospora conviva TaxID=3388432 RepID=UPI003C22036E